MRRTPACHTQGGMPRTHVTHCCTLQRPEGLRAFCVIRSTSCSPTRVGFIFTCASSFRPARRTHRTPIRACVQCVAHGGGGAMGEARAYVSRM
jgi:hypothetical protein